MATTFITGNLQPVNLDGLVSDGGMERVTASTRISAAITTTNTASNSAYPPYSFSFGDVKCRRFRIMSSIRGIYPSIYFECKVQRGDGSLSLSPALELLTTRLDFCAYSQAAAVHHFCINDQLTIEPHCSSNSVQVTVADKLYLAIMVQQQSTVSDLLERIDLQPWNLAVANVPPVAFCVLCANDQNESQSAAILQMLLQKGYAADAREKRTSARRTPLLLACRRALILVVDVLLLGGASPNHTDCDRNETPLRLTLRLLAESSDPGISDRLAKQALALISCSDTNLDGGGRGRSALELALRTSNSQVIEAIMTKGHSNLHPALIKRCLHLLDSENIHLALNYKKQLRKLLVTLLEPDSLENLCISVISNSMQRKPSKVTVLPCSTSVKERIQASVRICGQRQSHLEISEEKLAYGFLQLL